MGMVYTIWREMSGNGVPIGMALIIIADHLCVILKDQVRAVPVFCGAVFGASIRTACVQLSAASSSLRLPATPSVFVVCQDFTTAGPLTLFRA